MKLSSTLLFTPLARLAGLACALWLLALPVYAQRFVWAAGVRHVTSQAQSPLTQLATDAAGNVYVTGLLTETVVVGRTRLVSAGAGSSHPYDAYVAKIGPDGGWLWAAQLHTIGTANTLAIKVDPQGRPTLTGYYEGALALVSADSTAGPALPGTGHTELFAAQLDATGHWLWAAHSTTAGTALGLATNGLGLAFDAAGQPLVAGLTTGSTTLGALGAVGTANAVTYFVATLANGTWQSQRVLPAVTGAWEPSTGRVVLTEAGALTVTGRVRGPAAFGPLALPAAVPLGAAVVAHAPAAGNWQWTATATATGNLLPWALAADATGTTWVGGAFSGRAAVGAFAASSQGQDDAWVARLDAAGNWQGLATAGGGGNDAAEALTPQAGGGMVATGMVGGTTAFGPFAIAPSVPFSGFVATLSPSGAWSSAVALSGAVGNAAALLPAGQIAVAGSFFATAGFGALQLSSPANPLQSTGFCTVLELPRPTGTRTGTAAAAIALYPSPAHDQATLTFPAETVTRRICLLDALGCSVRVFPAPANATAAPLDLTGLAPGLYVVRCGTASGKLVVE